MMTHPDLCSLVPLFSMLNSLPRLAFLINSSSHPVHFYHKALFIIFTSIQGSNIFSKLNDFILIFSSQSNYILWLARPCINICPATLRAWERLERWWLRLTPQRKPEDAVNVPVKVSFVLVCSCRLWSATSWVCRETTCCRCARHLSSSSTWLIFGGAWVWNWQTHMNFTQMSCDS